MTDMFDALITEMLARAAAARKDAHALLAKQESSGSRVILLRQLPKKLSNLPIDIQSYFTEACSCLEHNHLRAATVMAWAGFFHVFADALYRKHASDIQANYPKWVFHDLAELKENVVESQIVDAAKTVHFISKTDVKVFHGQLATRNQCAHPTLYKPTLNSTIGYVETMVDQTIRFL